jgi:hypothetical protein
MKQIADELRAIADRLEAHECAAPEPEPPTEPTEPPSETSFSKFFGVAWGTNNVSAHDVDVSENGRSWQFHVSSSLSPGKGYLFLNGLASTAPSKVRIVNGAGVPIFNDTIGFHTPHSERLWFTYGGYTDGAINLRPGTYRIRIWGLLDKKPIAMKFREIKWVFQNR